MTDLFVPLPPELEKAIDNLLKWEAASNQADVVRMAILRLEEKLAKQLVLEGSKRSKRGNNQGKQFATFQKKSDSQEARLTLNT